jgi:hypothetical protein
MKVKLAITVVVYAEVSGGMSDENVKRLFVDIPKDRIRLITPSFGRTTGFLEVISTIDGYETTSVVTET